jgi:hypothetical protein
MNGGAAPKKVAAPDGQLLVNPDSLAQTIDALNEAFYKGHLLTHTQRLEAARWIAGRHGQPRAYANMFAPTEEDLKAGIRVFTGEKISTKAGTSHVLGEEACRTLILLEISEHGVLTAIEEAEAGIRARVEVSEKKSPDSMGLYCCGICSVSFWRHLIVGGVNWSERRLVAGQKQLKAHRSSGGKWKRFPYWYTLLALSEMDGTAARDERRYAAPALERFLKRKAKADVIGARHRAVAERVLSLS